MPAPTSGLTSSLLGTANGLISYAQGRMAAVDSFVNSLTGQVLSLVAPSITPSFPVGGSAPAIHAPTPPTFVPPVWVAPGFPLPLTAILDVGDLDIAPFDDNPPVINYGTAPTPFVGQLPDAPPVNLSFDDPTLVVNLPAPPDLLSLSVVKFDGLNLPVFDAEAPELIAVEPTIREYVPGAQYTSGLLTALQSTLLDRITSGGTGLTPDVENAIWDRGREREARSKQDAIDSLDQMESLGFAFPPGIYLDARLKIETETAYQNAGHSREVMIQQSTLMLDNVKTALTLSVDLEGKLIDYTNSVENRIFESVKYATEAGVQIYNAKVQAFAAMTETYKAKVQIYTALIQAEVSKVDAYRAQISAEEAKASINQSLVAQYKVQVDAALSNVEIYKAEIEGIQAKATIERTKVEVFGAQVSGFTAQVNAYTAGVEGFRATMAAEATKQDVYKSQVEAFTARIGANTAQINSRIAAYEGLIAGKTAEYDGYKAAVAGESARVDAIAKTSSVIADTYKSQVEGISAFNEVLTKQWQATLDQQQQTARIGIDAAKANAELYVSTRSIALDAAKTGAQVAAQIGAAAINAVNFSGSVSSSEGYSGVESVSHSDSSSTSDSNGTSTNYNYNTSV